MPLPTISRADFITAVEAGVRSALDNGLIDLGHAATLRAFAAEHVGPVATGCFDAYDDGTVCGCPLSQTGLYRYTEGSRWAGRLAQESRFWLFYGAYDAEAARLAGLSLVDDIVEVVA